MSWLYLPAGITQLLYLVAAQENVRGLDQARPGRVLSVCFLFTEDMGNAMREAAESLGLEYLGNLDSTLCNGLPLSGRAILRQPQLILWPKLWIKQVLRKCGLPPGLKTDGIALSVRPTVYDDLWVESVLDPAETLYVVDGINPRPPDRDLRGLKWRGMRPDLKRLPSSCDIHSPPELLKDAAQIGRPCPIPTAVIQRIYSRYRTSPKAAGFEALLRGFFDQPREESVVIFSQHLSLAKHCSHQAEIEYYTTLIRQLIQSGARRVLFKPHPRDPETKLSAIQAASDPARVRLVPAEYQPVPFEPFGDLLKERTCLAISTNSSALLTYRAITDNPTLSADFTDFTPAFRGEVTAFSRKHAVELFEADQPDALSRFLRPA